MTAKKMKPFRPLKAWAGFSGGKLLWWPADDKYTVADDQLSIYRTYKGTRARFVDVRRVLITPAPPKRRKKP